MKWTQHSYIILIIFFVNVLNAAKLKNGQTRKDLTIGGRLVSISDAQWQVSLFQNRQLICGGSLLSDDIVLTAASCIKDVEPAELLVRAGTPAFKTGGQLRKVKETVHHPNYVKKNHSFNIGLLQLMKALNTSKNLVGRVKLPSPKSELPSSVYVYGWGISSGKKNGKMTKNLRYTKTNTYSEKRCSQHLSEEEESDFVFCSGDRTKAADICTDDMGSPGITNGNVQFGVVSDGGACSQTHTTIFVNLAKLKSWITDRKEEFEAENKETD